MQTGYFHNGTYCNPQEQSFYKNKEDTEDKEDKEKDVNYLMPIFNGDQSKLF